MTSLPIRRMTLYKHGVGYFERRAKINSEAVTLSFRVAEMNDILKSLTAISWGEGQVLGVDYATPQSEEERLAGCSIRLGDGRSLRDLLASLRGRLVMLHLDQAEMVRGTLLGLDEVDKEQPLASSLVSLLVADTAQVQAVPLGRVQAVTVQDEQAAADLRFFLQTAVGQEDYRQVTVRLTPGEHDLMVSYVAPAPTWRVSYRLVTEPEAEGGPTALLLGWGIFDNRMEEDLAGVALSLVAGMPISFVYDLYTPFTPERPVVTEEARVAAGPVGFGAALSPAMADADMARGVSMAMMAPSPAGEAAMPRRAKMSRAELRDSAPAGATGEALGELFQYNITTPVTVGRGQSAMVPILSADLAYRKDLLYNGQQLPVNPVASLRFNNSTGLTLERGPVTVVEGGEYVGEAILPFTVETSEFIVPYAVELGVKVSEDGANRREIRGLSISGAYLLIEEWDVRTLTYQLTNSTAEEKTVLVEHPRQSGYDLFETQPVVEQTDAHYRFAVVVPGRGETKLRVQVRQLVTRREELQRQSYANLQHYLRRGLLDKAVYEKIAALLRLREEIARLEKRLQEIEQERGRIYKGQQQVQGNMQALGMSGKEGALRSQYVDQLADGEGQLKRLGQEEAQRRAEIKQFEQQIQALMASLG